jgi:murein L,D-transpeptidase YafK
MGFSGWAVALAVAGLVTGAAAPASTVAFEETGRSRAATTAEQRQQDGPARPAPRWAPVAIVAESPASLDFRGGPEAAPPRRPAPPASPMLAASPLRASDSRVKVTRITIHKGAHTMELRDKDGVTASYPVSLGPGGAGVKHREGDKVTPVGHYHVISRGPSKSFTIFMRLDYPNAEDRKRFAARKADGTLPAGATIGGDIGIHGGTPDGWNKREDVTMAQRDWTLGCISVEDDEIRAIAKRVPDGTPVDIDDD